MNNKRWTDLSKQKRVGIVFLATIQIGLLAMALWDLAHRNADELRGSKRMWAGLVFINWFGPLAYFAIGRKDGLCSRCCSCCCGPSEA
jgi:hypothetical protein